MSRPANTIPRPQERSAGTSARGAVWSRYALALAAVAAATMLTYALYAAVGAGSMGVVFVFYFAAVFLSARRGGLGPGLLAIALSAVVGNFRFFSPYGFPSLELTLVVQTLLFVSVALLFVYLSEQGRRSEEVARRSEESLATTLKSIGDAVITTDVEGRVLFLNAVAEKLTGWTDDEARGCDLSEVFRIVNEKTRAVVESPVAKVLREGGAVGLANHTVLLAKDGREIPIDDSGAPISDEGGHVVGVVLVFHDITERRKSEAALQRRERELTDFVENATVGLHWVGADGTILWANRAELEMLGYDAEEYIGHNIVEFHADRPIIDDILDRLTRNEALHEYDARLRAKDGSARYVQINSNVMWGDDGEFIHTRCFTRDVTARRQAEEARRESEERLLAIAETASDAIITIDEESRMLFTNSAAEKIFGHARAEMDGQQLTMLMPDYLRRVHEEALGRYVETGRRHISWESVRVPGLHKDGREIPLEVSFAEFVRNGRHFFTGVARDVTERTRAEVEREQLGAQIEGERRRLRDIVGNVPGVVWEAWGVPDAANQRIDFVSDYVEEMLGYTVGEWVSTPNFWLSIVHPEDREHAAAEARRKFESGLGGTNRFRWVTKDGRVIPVETQSVVIRDQRGEPVGMRGVTMDITARERAEEEIRESERRYRALADAMPQIVWTARPDGYFDYYNRRWFEYTGKTFEETRGWGWQPVLHPNDVEHALRTWATSIETGEPYRIEYRFRRASDAEYRWHLGRAEPLRDAGGRIVKWFGTGTDIHDQKQAEERLRFLAEAGALLASSLDYEATLARLARLGVAALGDYCVIDVVEDDASIRRVATAHRDPSKEELTAELRRFPPDPGAAGHGVAKALRTGRTEITPLVTEESLRGLARDTEHADVLLRLGLKSFIIVPLVTRGRAIGALSFALTRAARAHTPTEVSFAEELARLAALAIDNARLYGRAREVNRAKDEFLATLSHELRTPLTPIIGWTHMLRSGHINAPDTAHGLRVIDKNSQALSRLINDLLDMSSILSGKMRIESAAVDLGSVVREAVETTRPLAEARGVSFDIAASEGDAPFSVSGDRTRLVQVFWNLLNNAVKFSPQGGRVRIEWRADDASARVEVSDEGQGIPPEFLPHVFERFRQADGSTTRSHGGLGIGLALVKSFVEAHGGTVGAASEGEGRGSRFAVSLPLLQHAPTEGAPPAERASEEDEEASSCEVGESCHVLLVEDSRDTLDMLRVVFGSRGYRTTTCATAEEALRIAESSRFDIIVSDIGLPHLDGYELIRRLRRLPHLSDTPAVALTGYAASKDAEAALAAGFDAHIPKPVDPSVLAEEIEQLLQQKVRPEETEA
ncbi:MAG: PAS domain S-box protein [Acidobacteria bacterium]|nr:PAS domain S-box protein [Acidobacteriota bacterium]